jgi:hypothetical protein
MTDKELIHKLNILKQVSPEHSWKKETREILLSQISNSAAGEIKINFWEKAAFDLKNVFSFMPRAVWGTICLLFVLSGGAFGAYAAKYTRPGDNFYAARIIKERAQIALTFNKEEKAKLDMKLANIHAREITEVLSSPNFDYKNDGKKAEKLALNFREEINTVKARLSEIKKIQENNAIAGLAVSAQGGGDNAKVGIGSISNETDKKVYGVEAGKEKNGLQVYEPAGSRILSGGAKIPTTTLSGNPADFSSSSLSAVPLAAAQASTTNANDKIEETLNRAAESFETKDWSGAKDRLEEVGIIIDKIDQGSVKGASEAATATPEGTVSIGIIGSSSVK